MAAWRALGSMLFSGDSTMFGGEAAKASKTAKLLSKSKAAYGGEAKSEMAWHRGMKSGTFGDNGSDNIAGAHRAAYGSGDGSGICVGVARWRSGGGEDSDIESEEYSATISAMSRGAAKKIGEK